MNRYDLDEIQTLRAERTRKRPWGKTELFLERRDPYGFIHPRLGRGPIPQELDQAFTSWDLAEKAVDDYLTTHTPGA